jgi:DNA-directed RNA polymerase specialized sigma54-like protein
MEPKFNQNQSQKMSLSPQMRLYLHLLHLPIMDLRQAVEDALEENPMLEEVASPAPREDTETPAPSAAKSSDEETAETLPDDWAAKDPLSFTNTPSDLSRRKPEDTRKIKDFLMPPVPVSSEVPPAAP